MSSQGKVGVVALRDAGNCRERHSLCLELAKLLARICVDIVSIDAALTCNLSYMRVLPELVKGREWSSGWWKRMLDCREAGRDAGQLYSNQIIVALSSHQRAASLNVLFLQQCLEVLGPQL